MIAVIYARKSTDDSDRHAEDGGTYAMTLSEFVSKLTEGRGEVTLPGGIKLTSAAFYGLLPTVLADALGSFLPGDSEIHSGWQVATLGDTDSRHEWLLIIGDALVLVRATPGAGEPKGMHDVVVRELPLAAAVPEVRLSYFTDRFRGGAGDLIEAELTFTVGETFTVQMEGRDGQEAFRRFARELRAAIDRARGRSEGKR